MTRDKVNAWIGKIVMATFGIGLTVIVIKVMQSPSPNHTIREKNGVDTLLENDSAYVIKYRIDTAWEQLPERDN